MKQQKHIPLHHKYLVMLIKKFFIVVLFLSLSSFVNVHKYYISLTQIDYISDSKSVQITMNIFMDDLQETINKSFSQEFDLTNAAAIEDSHNYIKEYLESHFKLKINGQDVSISYLGNENEGDIVYLYTEVENIEQISTIEVECTMLTDFFPEQQNLVKLKVNGEFDSLLLTKKNDKGLLNF